MLAPLDAQGRKWDCQNTRILDYLLDLLDIWIFIFMDDVVRPHSFLSFIQGHYLLKIRG